MGLKLSPYQAVQAILVVKEVILGDRTDPANIFRWDHIRMNLPGSAEYDPSLPGCGRSAYLNIDGPYEGKPEKLQKLSLSLADDSTKSFLRFYAAARAGLGACGYHEELLPTLSTSRVGLTYETHRSWMRTFSQWERPSKSMNLRGIIGNHNTTTSE
jgi:hypothetical protein